MNSFWQVAKTYLWRPRFWIFGGSYLLINYWMAPRSPEQPYRGSGRVRTPTT